MKIKKEYMGYVMNLLSFIFFLVIINANIDREIPFLIAFVISLIILGFSIYYMLFSKYKIINLICISIYTYFVVLGLGYGVLVWIQFTFLGGY